MGDSTHGRPATAADCLDKVVKFLDLGDEMQVILARLAPQYMESDIPSRAVQEDLEKWVKLLRSDPELDARLMTELETQ